MSWIPPKSSIGMLQEELWPDKWKILVTCILHNQTSRKQVDKVYQNLFKLYPCSSSMACADQNRLAKILKPLGLHNRRSKSLIRFSKEYDQKNWKVPSDLYACGKYADDCYKVFCTGEWRDVKPTDKALNMYHNFLKEKFPSQGGINA